MTDSFTDNSIKAEEHPPGKWSIFPWALEIANKVGKTFGLNAQDAQMADVAEHAAKETLKYRKTGNVWYVRQVIRNRFIQLKAQRAKAVEAETHYHQAVYENTGIERPFWEEVTDQYSRHELIRIIQEACSMEEYTIIYMHYFEELSFVEISNQLKMKENTVKSHARRGKDKLRDYFQKTWINNE